MKTDGLFVVHDYTIPITSSNKPFRIVFFGDVHRDAKLHAAEQWQAFLTEARAMKDTWFFAMGDYLDSTSTSERSCLGAISDKMHETFLADMEALQMEKIKLIAKELSFMKGRLIGLLNGNHYYNFKDGTNSDQQLCRLLDCKYLGVSTFTRLTLNYTGRCTSLDIWAHHGAGSGRLPGGSINRVEQMREIAQADIFCMGHDHKKGVWSAAPRFYLTRSGRDGLKMGSRQQWLIRSGSFLESYRHGERSYNVDAARGPCSIGHVELIVSVNHGDKTMPAVVTIRGVA